MKNRLVKKTFISIILISLFLISCRHPFLNDPRLYNKTDNSAANKPTEDPDLIPDDSSVILSFDKTEEWYNNPSCNGDSENPSATGFNSEEFDKAVIHASFDKDSIPSFELISKDAWGEPTDENYHEYTYSGPDTTAIGISVKGVTYMQYRGMNPCYKADGTYNKNLQQTKRGNPRLSRFYFYRFMADSPVKLNNFLIAIDTYSKLIFQFAKPENPKDLIPQNWTGTDSVLVDGKSCFFYEYDPIGYVTKNNDGKYSVVLYEWFKNNLKNGFHDGTINKEYSGLARKVPDGQGSSPFRQTSEMQIDFYDAVKGLSFSGRSIINQKPSEMLYNFVFTEDGKNVNIKVINWKNRKSEDYTGNVILTEGSYGKASAVIAGKTVNFTVNKNQGETSLYISDKLNCVISDKFNDPTPSFEIKVSDNPTFRSPDNKISYFFKNGYKQIAISGKVYNYDSAVNIGDAGLSNFRMGYSRKDGITTLCIGVQISKDGKTVQCTDEGRNALSKKVDWNTLGKDAVRVNELEGKTFYEIIKNKSFTRRELDGYTGNDGKGYGMNLYNYKFGVDGKSVTFKVTPWGGTAETIEDIPVTLLDDDNTKASIVVNGETKILSLNEAATILYAGADLYVSGFSDPGPSFANRVKDNPKYNGANNKYIFSEGYKKLQVDNVDYNFVQFDESKRNRCIYSKTANKVTTYYGVELSSTNGKKDNIIKMTNGMIISASLINWNSLAYEAERK